MFCFKNCETAEVNQLKYRIKELEDQLALETSWAEGEIEFWQDQCDIAEAKECQCKPWWRYIFS